MKLKVNGMSCGHCKARIEKALLENYNIKSEVNLASKVVEFELNGANLDSIKNTINDLGFTCEGFPSFSGVTR